MSRQSLLSVCVVLALCALATVPAQARNGAPEIGKLAKTLKESKNSDELLEAGYQLCKDPKGLEVLVDIMHRRSFGHALMGTVTNRGFLPSESPSCFARLEGVVRPKLKKRC